MTHRLKWRSRYSLLFFHVTIRVASQACGLAFGMLGFSNMDVFLAYLILGAEGYFTLVRPIHICFSDKLSLRWESFRLSVQGDSWYRGISTIYPLANPG